MSNQKLAIIVEGGWGVGKTLALKTVAACLATYGTEATSTDIERVRTKKENPWDVTMVLHFWGKGGNSKKKLCVGIHSDSDVPKCWEETIKKFINYGCDLIIFPMNTDKKYPKDTIDAFSSQYKCVRVSLEKPAGRRKMPEFKNNWKKAAKEVLERAVDHIKNLQQ